MVSQLVESMMEQVKEKADLNKPVGMLNMIRFRDVAKYPESAGFAPCSGAEAYQRYSEAVMPILDRMGAKVLMNAVSEVAGPANEWDLIFIMYYPTATYFATLWTDEDYRKTLIHRDAAVADNRTTMLQLTSESLAEICKVR
jgi:uncharacterized protein (DUF1330 family)